MGVGVSEWIVEIHSGFIYIKKGYRLYNSGGQSIMAEDDKSFAIGCRAMLKNFSLEIDRRRPEAAPRSGSGALLLSMKVKQKRRKSCRELISINPFRPRSFSRYLCLDQWIRSQKKNLKQSYKISCTWYNFSVKKKASCLCLSSKSLLLPGWKG